MRDGTVMQSVFDRKTARPKDRKTKNPASAGF
jgi:hypothetical protein